MCEKTDARGCCRPEELTDKPEACSPEQVRRCHGDLAKHPCCEPPDEQTTE